MATKLGDIKLNNKWYPIDIQSYRMRDVVDFSPRASVPGGGSINSDLMLYQPMMQTDWSHGFGWQRYEDASGYMRTDGNVDTRQAGLAMLYTKATSSDTEDFPKVGMVVHKGNIYTWGDRGIRKYDGSTWVTVNAFNPIANTAVSVSGSSVSTLSQSVTIPKRDSKWALLVAVSTTTDVTITSCQYNGEDCILLSSTGTTPKTHLLYLTNPAEDAHTLTVDFSGSTRAIVTALPVAYVDNITPFGTVATAGGSAATLATASANSEVGDLVIGIASVAGGVDVTDGAEQVNAKETTISSYLTSTVSTKPGTTSTTMSWTWSTNQNWSEIAVTINPATSLPINTMFSNGEYLFVVPRRGRIRRTQNSFSIALQPTEAEAEDATISAASATTNYKTETTLTVGTDSRNHHRSFLVKFDLTAIPSTATVKTATFKPYLTDKTSTVPEIKIARLLKSWTEARVTWNSRDGSTAWSTAGARGSGTDISSTVMHVSTPTNALRTHLELSLDLTEFGLMQTNNFGMVIYEESTVASRSFTFASSNNKSNPDYYPLLEVTYENDNEWEDAGVDANSIDYNWITIHSGKMYAGVRDKNYIHSSSASDLSDLHGTQLDDLDTTNDTDRITVGIGKVGLLWAESYAGSMYIARTDGLWQFGSDNITRRVLDFSDAQSEYNFKSAAVYNGYLTFPVQDSVYQWNGSRLSNITPKKLSDTFPYKTYGQFDNFISSQNYLYCTAKTSESLYSPWSQDLNGDWFLDSSEPYIVYTESLLCFDGVAWHKLCDTIPQTQTSGSTTSLKYDPYNSRLWYHTSTPTEITSYIPLQKESNFPYADFPTNGTNSLITSLWDMGFARIEKSSPSLLVEASNIFAPHCYLKIYYSLDSTSQWMLWGDITEGGVTELTMPGTLKTVEYNSIALRVDFITDYSTQSPVLENLTLRFLMRPSVAYGWNFNIPLVDNYVYGAYEDTRTAHDLQTEINTARDSKAPVVYRDIDDTEYYVYITASTATALERNVDKERDGVPSIEKVLNINLIEAK